MNFRIDKKTIAVVLLIAVTVFAGCVCKHEWKDATCTEPKTCIKCGETEGEPLGHSWKDATCTSPKTCAVCGATEGTPKDHNWTDATCSKPKTCSMCGKTEGDALGHKADPATCTEDSICSVCGEIVAKATGHQANPPTCTEDSVCSVCGETVEKASGHIWEPATAAKPKTCKICGLTEGEPLGYQYFPKNSYEFINTYNKSKHALGSLNKNDNTMKITGTGLKVVFFVWDVSESALPPGMWSIPKMDFNAMLIRLTNKGTNKYDSNGQAAITMIGQSFAEVFDPTFDSYDMLSNGSYSIAGNSFTLTYSHNGFDYKIEGNPFTIGNSSSYDYDFFITLSENGG